MLSKEQIQQEAQRINGAEKACQQVKASSIIHADITMDDAYAVQKSGINIKLAEGRRIVGHKIGLTSRAMQIQMNINEPDYGTLTDDMLFADGGDIVAAEHLDPCIEIELAFILKDRLEGENVTLFDVLNATDYVIPAFELIAARSYRVDPDTGYIRTIKDTISDNAANAGVVLGGRPIRPTDIDLRWVAGLCYRNGVLEETGVAAGVLNHPANGIIWLTKCFAPHGITLEPGQIILTGSFIRPVSVRTGDTFHGDFGELGSISCYFN